MYVRIAAALLIAAISSSPAARAADLASGPVELTSIGPIAFGPEGLLLVSDPMGAAIYAVETGDASAAASSADLHIEDVRAQIAGLLGTEPADVQVIDVAVNPASGAVFLAVTRGAGPDAMPVILRTDGSGKLEEVSLADVPHAKASIGNAPESAQGRRGNPRLMTITDLAFVDGRVFVAGLSNEEFASKLRSIPYPFESDADSGASLEIFHGAHGRIETRSPIMTFAPYSIGGESHVLAAYTCTPLVKFRVADLAPGEKVTGETIAELGNRNRPLDMFVYQKGGVNYILMANSSRGVMKISTQEVDSVDQIEEPVEEETAGLPYETIEALQGILQLDRLNESLAVALVEDGDGAQNLTTVELP